MKIYKCDVCGAQFAPREIGAVTSDKKLPIPGLFGVLVEGKDLCPRCFRVGQEIDFDQVIRQHWRLASYSDELAEKKAVGGQADG